MAAGTLDTFYARPFALFGPSAESIAFRNEVEGRMIDLGLHAKDFETFTPEKGDRDRAAGSLNLRVLLNWCDGVVLPDESQPPDERTTNAANVAMLGRLAATLAARFTEPSAV